MPRTNRLDYMNLLYNEPKLTEWAFGLNSRDQLKKEQKRLYETYSLYVKPAYDFIKAMKTPTDTINHEVSSSDLAKEADEWREMQPWWKPAATEAGITVAARLMHYRVELPVNGGGHAYFNMEDKKK